jgi:hypothetical protein
MVTDRETEKAKARKNTRMKIKATTGAMEATGTTNIIPKITTG